MVLSCRRAPLLSVNEKPLICCGWHAVIVSLFLTAGESTMLFHASLEEAIPLADPQSTLLVLYPCILIEGGDEMPLMHQPLSHRFNNIYAVRHGIPAKTVAGEYESYESEERDCPGST